MKTKSRERARERESAGEKKIKLSSRARDNCKEQEIKSTGLRKRTKSVIKEQGKVWSVQGEVEETANEQKWA